jgi:hypothetical protein
MFKEVDQFLKSNIYLIRISINDIKFIYHNKFDPSLSLFILDLINKPKFFKKNIKNLIFNNNNNENNENNDNKNNEINNEEDEYKDFEEIEDFTLNKYASLIKRHFILCEFDQFKIFLNQFLNKNKNINYNDMIIFSKKNSNNNIKNNDNNSSLNNSNSKNKEDNILKKQNNNNKNEKGNNNNNNNNNKKNELESIEDEDEFDENEFDNEKLIYFNENDNNDKNENLSYDDIKNMDFLFKKNMTVGDEGCRIQ